MQDAMAKEADDTVNEDGGSKSGSSVAGDDDFDQYLRELDTGEEVTTAGSVGPDGTKDDGTSTPDLDDYVKDLQ